MILQQQTGSFRSTRSDMHGTRPGKHEPRLKEGIQWLYENTDGEYADAVCFGNAVKLLGAEE